MYFLSAESSAIATISICASQWLADQVLERLRKGMACVENELEMRKWQRFSQFCSIFISQKFA